MHTAILKNLGAAAMVLATALLLMASPCAAGFIPTVQIENDGRPDGRPDAVQSAAPDNAAGETAESATDTVAS